MSPMPSIAEKTQMFQALTQLHCKQRT